MGLLAVVEGQSTIIMVGSVAAGRQTWPWSNSEELTSEPQVTGRKRVRWV